MQYGVSTDSEFFGVSSSFPAASAWNKFPTPQKPLTRYKFASVELMHSADLLIVSRQTYSILDWLGDLGGLLDALYLIANLFMGPLSAWALKATLMSTIFFRKSSNYQEENHRQTTRQNGDQAGNFDSKEPAFLSKVTADFKSLVAIPFLSYWKAHFCCRRDYKRMLAMAESAVTK